MNLSKEKAGTNNTIDMTPYPSSCRQTQVGKAIYRVTSVFLGEKDFGQTLEQLIIRKAIADSKVQQPAG